MTDRKQPNPAEEDELPEGVAELHPIAFFLAKELKPGEEEAFAPFPEETLVHVAEFLAALTEKEDGGDELVHATHSMAAFVIGNHADSPMMAEQIRDLLHLPFVADALRQWSVAADPEHVKKIAERFGNFSGLETQMKAPQVGEEKPEGAVDLNALNFPKRL